jgi:uncharacterized membrane protein YedE/YeeE
MSGTPRIPALWRRPDVYAGLIFVGAATLGLVIAKDYPMGTAVRMGTGYVPMLLCWTLLALGAVILLTALVSARGEAALLGRGDLTALRPLLFVTAAVVIFALTIERLGLIIALCLTIATGSLANREVRVVETLVAMVALTLVCWAVFGYALALPFPIWPRL